MKADNNHNGFTPKISQAEFDQIIFANQEIQKRNPFGSEAHRKAYEAIKKAVKNFQGHDIGDYAE